MKAATKAFTLDTNCVVALENSEPAASAVQALSHAHSQGLADVAVVAISASENQKSGKHNHSVSEFRRRLAALGLAHLNVLKPMCYWGVTFWDHCLWSDRGMQEVERRIHETLFPNVEFIWANYCKGEDIESDAPSSRWRNCKCDVQAAWSHIHNDRDVFVTSDRNFHKATKKSALIKLGAKAIECPETAVSLL